MTEAADHSWNCLSALAAVETFDGSLCADVFSSHFFPSFSPNSDFFLCVLCISFQCPRYPLMSPAEEHWLEPDTFSPEAHGLRQAVISARAAVFFLFFSLLPVLQTPAQKNKTKHWNKGS